MYCGKCGKPHSATATYCPHCGADVEKSETPPGGESLDPGERASGEAGLGLVSGTAEGARPTAVEPGGRRTWVRVFALGVSLLVMVAGIVLYFQRREVEHRQRNAVEWIQQESDRLQDENVERLTNPGGMTDDEQAAADAAKDYASTQGLLGGKLDVESSSVTGSTLADVVLSDPSTGKKYHVTLMKSVSGWSALSMAEEQ